MAEYSVKITGGPTIIFVDSPQTDVEPTHIVMDISADNIVTLCGLVPSPENPVTLGCMCGKAKCYAPPTCKDCLTVAAKIVRGPASPTIN